MQVIPTLPTCELRRIIVHLKRQFASALNEISKKARTDFLSNLFESCTWPYYVAGGHSGVHISGGEPHPLEL